MRFRHVLVTMLNRRLIGRNIFPPRLELDEQWLRHRWDLFTAYTLPSVQAQTEQEFTWIVFCHPDSPAWFHQLLCETEQLFKVHFAFDAQDLEVLAHADTTDADALLVTRIDSDDAWHRKAMERIREDCEADPYTSEVVTFSDGYVLDHRVGQIRPYYDPSPPFSTKICLPPDFDMLDLGGSHTSVRKRYASRSISGGEPMFLLLGHHPKHRRRLFRPDDPYGWFDLETSRRILRTDFGVVGGGGRRASPDGPRARPSADPGVVPPPRSGGASAVRHSARHTTAQAERPQPPRVVVSIRSQGPSDLLPEAVKSVLRQTHRDLVVVLSKDDPEQDDDRDWRALTQFDDRRLFFLDERFPQGRTFADQVAAMSRVGGYLLVHGPDEISHPERVAILLETLRARHAVAAVSAHQEFDAQDPQRSCVVTPALEPAITTRPLGSHGREPWPDYHALFDTRALLSVGGCYGGPVPGYERLVLRLVQMVGAAACVSTPLSRRPPERSLSSLGRADEAADWDRLYREAYHVYGAYVQGSIGAPVLTRRLRALAWRHLTASQWLQLREAAERLRWQVRWTAAGQRHRSGA